METKAEKPKCIRKVQSAKKYGLLFLPLYVPLFLLSWLYVLPIFRRY